jgi:hypothetical protein
MPQQADLAGVEAIELADARHSGSSFGLHQTPR